MLWSWRTSLCVMTMQAFRDLLTLLTLRELEPLASHCTAFPPASSKLSSNPSNHITPSAGNFIHGNVCATASLELEHLRRCALLKQDMAIGPCLLLGFHLVLAGYWSRVQRTIYP